MNTDTKELLEAAILFMQKHHPNHYLTAEIDKHYQENKDYFTISRIHRDDLIVSGYAAFKTIDSDMEKVAANMHQSWLCGEYWDMLRLAADTEKIPKIIHSIEALRKDVGAMVVIGDKDKQRQADLVKKMTVAKMAIGSVENEQGLLKESIIMLERVKDELLYFHTTYENIPDKGLMLWRCEAAINYFMFFKTSQT